MRRIANRAGKRAHPPDPGTGASIWPRHLGDQVEQHEGITGPARYGRQRLEHGRDITANGGFKRLACMKHNMMESSTKQDQCESQIGGHRRVVSYDTLPADKVS